MKKVACFMALITLATAAAAQVRTVKPVTQAMLLNPPADDWLMFSRTYDAQRYSPLDQINKQNVGRLSQVWKNDLQAGVIESIPIVHDGVMYLQVPSQE